MARTRTEGRRRGPVSAARHAAWIVAVVLAVTAAGCGHGGASRLAGRSPVAPPTTQPEVSIDPANGQGGPGQFNPQAPPGTQDKSYAIPKPAPTQGKSCGNTDARSYVPPTLDGYSLAAGGDATAALAGNAQAQQYVKSAAALTFSRSDGKGGVILVLVFDPSIAGLISSSVDTLMLGLAGLNSASKQTINGYLVYTGTSHDSKSAFSTQFCQNVFMVVTASDADVALDIGTKILR